MPIYQHNYRYQEWFYICILLYLPGHDRVASFTFFRTDMLTNINRPGTGNVKRVGDHNSATCPDYHRKVVWEIHKGNSSNLTYTDLLVSLLFSSFPPPKKLANICY